MEILISVLTSLHSEIHRRHRRQLRCISERVDTDDHYQRVCVRAWRNRTQCRGRTDAEIRNWVSKIAANECRNLLSAHLDAKKRSVKRNGRLELQPWRATYREDPSDGLIAAETRAEQRSRVMAELPSLTSRRREAVTLHYLGEWPYKRNAEHLGVRDDWSRQLACEGIKQMRELVCG